MKIQSNVEQWDEQHWKVFGDGIGFKTTDLDALLSEPVGSRCVELRRTLGRLNPGVSEMDILNYICHATLIFSKESRPITYEEFIEHSSLAGLLGNAPQDSLIACPFRSFAFAELKKAALIINSIINPPKHCLIPSVASS